MPRTASADRPIDLNGPEALADWLKAVPAASDRRRQLSKLSRTEVRELGKIVDDKSALELFESVDDGLAAHGLERMASEDAARAIATLDIDHASDVLRKMRQAPREAVLAPLPADRAQVFRSMLAWPADSAAAHMIPEVLTVPAVLAKELSTVVLIGLTMGLAAVIRAWTLGVGPEVTLTVSLTVVAIVLWSSFVASVLPPVLKKLRIDPALVSAPLIATVVDGTGLMIYFWIAHLTLSQLQGL
jgi:Mg/Co/Ni transporter MgtE